MERYSTTCVFHVKRASIGFLWMSLVVDSGRVRLHREPIQIKLHCLIVRVYSSGSAPPNAYRAGFVLSNTVASKRCRVTNPISS